MSFRNLNKLDCINLLNNITNKSLKTKNDNDKVYKGLYVSNEETYYIIGTIKHFYMHLGSIYEQTLKDGMTMLSHMFSTDCNNKFIIEYYENEVKGAVILINKIKNLNDLFHKNAGGNKKTIAIPCESCEDYLIRYKKAEFKGNKSNKECKECNRITNHTHTLCSYCLIYGKGKELKESLF